MISTHSTNRTIFIDLVILSIIALTARLIGVGIDHLPVGDEMFHILAAQSWATNGTLAIADGIYDRSALFTKLVGILFIQFEDSLVVARMPAFIFGALWVLLLFLWLDKQSGRLAAWLGAILFCIAPHAIELSLYSRMYTVHGFIFLLGTMSVFSLICQKHTISIRIFLILSSIALFALALHLHNITIVGLLALITAIVIDQIIQHRHIFTNKMILVGAIISVLFLSVIGLSILYFYWDIFEPFWQAFTTPAYAKRTASFGYFHNLLLTSYPIFWLLLPVASIIVIIYKPRIGLFCVIVFSVIFVMHSVAGSKAERYIYYGMPFFFSIWAMALAIIIPPVNHFIKEKVINLKTRYWPQLKEKYFNIAFNTFFTMGIIVFLILGSTGAFARTFNLFQGESYYFGTKLSNWELTVPILKPIIEKAPIVLTTNFPKTLYYFERYDMAFSPVIVADILKGEEGGIDPRTGRPAIGTIASLNKLFEKYPNGIFVGEKNEWRNRFRMTDEASDFLEQNATQVQLPDASRIIAFTW